MMKTPIEMIDENYEVFDSLKSLCEERDPFMSHSLSVDSRTGTITATRIYNQVHGDNRIGEETVFRLVKVR